MSNSKKCTKCEVEKDIEEFSKAKKGLFNRQPKCKNCTREYYLKNKELIISRVTEYNTNNKEKISEYQKEYREKNKTKLTKYHSDYHKLNVAKKRTAAKKWAQENKARYNANMTAAHSKRRNKAEANGCNDLTAAQIQQLFEDYNACLFCGSTENLTLEHLLPISLGGQNTIGNCAISCSQCNSEKGKLTPLDFIVRMLDGNTTQRLVVEQNNA